MQFWFDVCVSSNQLSKGISAGNFCSCLLFKIYWDVSIFYNMCVFNLVFKRNQSGQLLQVFARNNASILDIISLNCAPETLRSLSKVLRRLFMIASTLKCAPETSTCAPETFSVLKFAPAKTCSKSARRGARWRINCGQRTCTMSMSSDHNFL